MRKYLIMLCATGLLSACGTTSTANRELIAQTIPKDHARVVVVTPDGGKYPRFEFYNETEIDQ